MFNRINHKGGKCHKTKYMVITCFNGILEGWNL